MAESHRFVQNRSTITLPHPRNPLKTMHPHHSYRPSPLEIKQLAEFDASLGDSPESEQRRKRIVYLRDALRQMQVLDYWNIRQDELTVG